VSVALCCHVDAIMPCSFFQDIDDEVGSYNDVSVGILCHEQESMGNKGLHIHSPFTTLHFQWESSWRKTLWWMLRACPRPCTLSLDLCTASQLPKVHEAHFRFYSTGTSEVR